MKNIRNHRGKNMKVLVGYMSKTGNTKKIAEAIYNEIEAEKEIKSLEEVNSLDGYDLAFLGFPVHAYGPDKKAYRWLLVHFIHYPIKIHFIAISLGKWLGDWKLGVASSCYLF